VSAGAAGTAGRLELDSDPAGALLVGVRVVPRAARDAVMGVRDGRLLVRLTAPPIEGRANAALVRLVARALGVPRGRVGIASGAGSRTKRLRIEGVARGDLERLASGV